MDGGGLCWALRDRSVGGGPALLLPPSFSLLPLPPVGVEPEGGGSCSDGLCGGRSVGGIALLLPP